MSAADGSGGLMAAAFFDFDRTLIDINSAPRYALWEYRQGRVSALQCARALMWSVGYHFSLVDIEAAYRVALAHYRGLPEAEARARTEAWYQAELVARAQPGALRALARHRRDGVPTVLLTNSSGYAADLATQQYGLDASIANVFPADASGLLLGTFEAPICYGEGKVIRATAWAASAGVDLQQSWFYTDSLSDLPMLEVVGYPVVVNPDPRLRREARRRGWPIEDWRR